MSFSDPDFSTPLPGFLKQVPETEGELDDKRVLIAHIREQHPNLIGIGGPEAQFGSAPLPESRLEELPFSYINAIHESAHLGLWGKHHTADDWLCKQLTKTED